MNLETGSHEGNADIYSYDSNLDTWSLDKHIEIIGNTDSVSIADSTNRDQVGVAISGDGQTVAIGNPKGGDVSTYQGQVLFYELDTSTNTWQFNDEIFGFSIFPANITFLHFLLFIKFNIFPNFPIPI